MILICEWGQPRSLAHALEQAHATQVEIGAAYAKWQMFDPHRLASKEAKRYWAKELGGPSSQRELFSTAGIKPSEWKHLFEVCRFHRVEPLVTPFDLEAVEILEALEAPAYKIASGDITYRRLLQMVGETQKKVFLSTGAASQDEIEQALEWLFGCEVVLMACDLVYPTEAKDAALAQRIPDLKRLRPEVGYSDHTRELVTGAVAASLGATVLEKHLTLDPNGEMPDDRMALTPSQALTYRRLSEQAHTLCQSVKGDPEKPARKGARRSAFAARDLPAGHTIGADDVEWLRPCPPGSIPADQDLTGFILRQKVGKGEKIAFSDLAHGVVA